MKDAWAVGVLSAIVLLFMSWLVWMNRARVLPGHNDFIQLYTGARLAGTPDLYDREAVTRLQMQTVGVTGDSWRYTRLPYYAALLWPLGRLPYRTAYGVWQLLSLAAVAGFAALWMPGRRDLTILFTLMSLPVWAGLMNGQDLSFLLLWIALAARWYRQDRPVAAGLVLALCAAKFHLFVLLPVLVAGQRAWRLGAGLAAGGVALAAASFAVDGARWPIEYWRVLTDPNVHPSAGNMPNLHGMLSFWPAALWLEWPLAAAAAAAVWWVASRADFNRALAATLAGGLLLSYHSYLPDCGVLLPAGLIGMGAAEGLPLRVTALFLLTPAAYFFLVQQTAVAAIVPASILGFVGLLTWEARVRLPGRGREGAASRP